ncbi:MAG TPA: c-type cytochrome [Povalibacter sp.]|nr:c-type cytochrome [Povalibacter sp.]
MRRRFLVVLLTAGLAVAATAGAAEQGDTAASTEAGAPDSQAKRSLRPAYLDLRRTPVITGDAAAGKQKAQLCFACHGENGVAPVPNFPNLVGQSTEYLYWSLVEYQRARGPESPMTPLVTSLSDGDMRDLAAYYASLPAPGADRPAAAAAPDAALIRTGERLFNDGDPQRGVPPCQGCHGVDGAGHPLARRGGNTRLQAYYRTYPALEGQSPDYITSRLTQYRDGQLHDSSNDFIMHSVAGALDDDSIRALAAWLASRQ